MVHVQGTEHMDKHTKLSEMSPLTVWEGFKMETTAHGVSHVNNARGWFQFLVFLLETGLSCIRNIYLNYEYNLDLTIEDRSKMFASGML